MVIEVIAAEVREAGGHHGHAFIAELRQSVARRFIGDMRNALARQAAEVGQEGHDIGRGQSGRNAFVGRGDAERADACRAFPRHAPDLPGHLDGGGLAVGAGHRDDMVGHGGEELRCEGRESAARISARGY